MLNSSKYVKYLVVDTSAFINNVQLQNYGEFVITIPEVIAEIRNKRQYRHLFSLTHEVELKDVFSESIVFVTEFAKKTGDYASLSATDIKLIALAYQMEIENVGRDHLKSEPVIPKFKVNSKTPRVQDSGADDGDDSEYDTARSGSSTEDEKLNENEEFYGDEFEEDVRGDDENEIHQDQEAVRQFSENESSEEDEEQNESELSEDDDEGWVTPANIHALRQTSDNCVEEKSVVVGCLSTDFAIQNVLMQIGLNVVTTNGKIIRQLRSYILRCYACFATTSNMKKVFCPKCGNKTLKRVSVYLDKDGNKRMFINYKKPISTRGKRFSLPMPKGGKHAVNPKLVADAKRPHQKPTRLARTKTDALQEDYIAGNSPFVMRDVHSRSAQHGFNKGKYVFKNWMRRNPNESKRNPKK